MSLPTVNETSRVFSTAEDADALKRYDTFTKEINGKHLGYETIQLILQRYTEEETYNDVAKYLKEKDVIKYFYKCSLLIEGRRELGELGINILNDKDCDNWINQCLQIASPFIDVISNEIFDQHQWLDNAIQNSTISTERLNLNPLASFLQMFNILGSSISESNTWCLSANYGKKFFEEAVEIHKKRSVIPTLKESSNPNQKIECVFQVIILVSHIIVTIFSIYLMWNNKENMDVVGNFALMYSIVSVVCYRIIGYGFKKASMSKGTFSVEQ